MLKEHWKTGHKYVRYSNVQYSDVHYTENKSSDIVSREKTAKATREPLLNVSTFFDYY
jgi:hypothetical protein